MKYSFIYLGKDKFTIIDNEDAPLVEKYVWHINDKYVVTTGGLLLHRLVMPWCKQQMVDHWNMDTLDNRKMNLRPSNSTQNTANQRHRRHKVFKSKSGGWYFQCARRSSCMFETEDEAFEAFKIEHVRVYGQYSGYSKLPLCLRRKPVPSIKEMELAIHKRLMLIEQNKKNKFAKVSKQIIHNGVTYASIHEAHRQLGHCRKSIKRWLQDNNNQQWRYICVD